MHAFRLLGQLECWQVQLVAAIARVQLEGWLKVWAPLMWVESHASKHYTALHILKLFFFIPLGGVIVH